MRKIQNQILLKTSLNRIETTQADDCVVPSDHYLSGLQAISIELAALRADEPVLNKLEVTSIHALVAYVACEHEMEVDVIYTLVKQHFDTDDVSKLHQSDFDTAMRYLVDLNPRELIN